MLGGENHLIRDDSHNWAPGNGSPVQATLTGMVHQDATGNPGIKVMVLSCTSSPLNSPALHLPPHMFCILCNQIDPLTGDHGLGDLVVAFS